MNIWSVSLRVRKCKQKTALKPRQRLERGTMTDKGSADVRACCDNYADTIRCNLCGAAHCHVHNKIVKKSDNTFLCRDHYERWEQCTHCERRIAYRKGMQCAAPGCFRNVCTTFSPRCNSMLDGVLVCDAHQKPCHACGALFAAVGARRLGPVVGEGDIYCARCFDLCVSYIVWRRTRTRDAINRDVLRIIVKYLCKK